MTDGRLGGSFRDPSGYLYRSGGTLYRQVDESYRENYDALFATGLYDELTAAGLLVPHAEKPLDRAHSAGAYRILEPRPIDFVSYPYEWCFGQLRDAALVTIEIQRRALARGMSLKDASAFNIQFHEGRPVLIDTLSFECYREGEPWIAYRQFCQHFLAPLLLASRVDVRLIRLFERYLDGIPLDLASRLLPRRTWCRFGPLLHVHLHARSLARFAQTPIRQSRLARPVSRTGHRGLIASLDGAIRRLSVSLGTTEWGDYERTHGYAEPDRAAKRALVAEYLEQVRPETVWDLGANTGEYSRLAAERGARVLAIDGDPAAVERSYQHVRSAGERGILPLWIDLTNPSPALGWGHDERRSLADRGPADLVLALALLHHLAIGNNVPLDAVAHYLSTLGRDLIVEFAPKADPQVQRLLASRADIFASYTPEGFERAFGERYEIRASVDVGSSGRRLFLMSRR
ncbi:MAG TPA: SAM-dependent methyltransferase [Gemmatimonadota bacterium]|nr:SAM-dependent methyltransferase [Gemmatimonadota bacterium]